MKITNKTSTKRILKEIEKFFDKNDWIQYATKLEKDPGKFCYCLSGAASEVCSNGSRVSLNLHSNNRPFNRAMTALAAVLPKRYQNIGNGNPVGKVIAYNDASDRTFNQIKRLLTTAIGE